MACRSRHGMAHDLSNPCVQICPVVVGVIRRNK